MTEEQIHLNICKYIALAYPNVLFNSDLSGVYLTNKYRASKIKKLRSSNGYPDIIIYEIGLGMYHALFLEVKKETPFKKDGTLKKNDHIQDQIIMHNKLRKRSYKVELVWTFDMAKEIIDNYLKTIKT